MGFTLPGIIDDPGSFSGNYNSPNPLLGPLPKNLISFAILCKELANVDKLPWNSVKASFVAKASNLFSAGTNFVPVKFEISLQNCWSNSLNEFKPVPTAVPPWAKLLTS